MILKNAKIINVYTGEILEGNVYFDEKIKLIDFDNNEIKKDDKIINLKGKYLSPTFIDAHIHIESSHLIPSEFEKLVLKSGVSKVVIDPHEIANVCGKDGILFMLNDAKYLDVYVMLPSCVPATELETNGAKITAKDIEELITLDRVLGLGEVMNYKAVINNEKSIIEKINIAKKYKKLIDGHCPGLRGEELNKYIEKGIMSDHEAFEIDEALEKLRLGLKLMIREGTVSKNIYLLEVAKKVKDKRNIILVSDDVSKDLDCYMVKILRKAIKYVSPIEAIQMVTANPANYLGIDIGIKPGNEASFIIFDDIEKFKINNIIIKGKFLNDILKDLNNSKKRIPKTLLKTVNCKIKKEDFLIEGIDYNKKDGKVRVIKPLKDCLITKEKILNVKKAKELLEANKLNKIFVIERHKNTGNVGKGLIEFLNKGTLASTYAHDSHNIIAIGNDIDDLYLAVSVLKSIGGGFVAVLNGKVYKVPLRVAGIMGDSLKTLEEIEKLNKIIEGWCNFEDPFLSMSFFSLPVIPELKITDKGLVKNMELVDLFINSF
ncbi:adenine deaminase [Methanocaldococcus villosus KIN24-T80]|uniref:Adenine deaminase n=1 Tax=Methanocaldococcus villosus KIN24-T80 TaxID=1069083 RepID=N6VTU5_9EURY|nr:adenine deaminase [Methanocaldococcus villosus]ENN96581.1 adenine deaminase [Methanocaldococcus villosus KIN24-T80]